jgi:hypothetical protein
MSDEGYSFSLVLPIGAVFVLLGVAIAVGGSLSAFNAIQAADAGVETEGTVVGTNITQEWEDDGTDQSEREEQDRIYVAQITYNYTVDGEQYTSSTHNVPPLVTDPGGTEFDSQQRAASFLADYDPGSSLTVYHMPDDPETSFLEKPTYSAAELALPFLFGLPFAVVGMGIILTARGIIDPDFQRFRDRLEGSDESIAESETEDDEWC